MKVVATSLPTLLTLLSLSGYVSALVDDSSPLKYNGPSTAFPRTMSANATSFAIASNSGMQQDMDIIRARRIDAAVGGVISVASISSWLSTLGADGKWPDSEIDYTTGCDAQRANWPAQVHWQRITAMSAAYHGGSSNASEWVNNTPLRSAISVAMDWWFSRDFTKDECLDGGGSPACPCGTPGLWNTNWFANVLLVPYSVAQACQLLNDTLTITQASNCSHITTRAYSPFYRKNPPGFVSGANIIEMAKIGIEQSLRVFDAALLAEAYGRVHAQMVVEPAVRVDGIKPDGSFGQHTGLMYNGNYGKDYANSVLALEEAAAGTQFSADQPARSAFGSLFDGDRWMIFYNALTGVLHWDFSTIPRFISFPVVDSMATGNIQLNLTQVASVGEQWGSDNLTEFAVSLAHKSTDANAGRLVGNRMFWSNDYMVHRGRHHVTTLKMFSNRTKNTECTNTQNPLGFHLADGASFTYLRGSEYEDIAASWDWNLIPGTTVDYEATPLTCDNASYVGVEGFVGGASDGNIGAAVMRYTNPATGSLSWQKVWFFLDDDVQHVMVSNLSSKTDAPVYSVLDQKRLSGPIFVNSRRMKALATTTSRVRSLWHDNIGYTFERPDVLQDLGAPKLSVQTGERTGKWSAIGTSTQQAATDDLFSARLVHDGLAGSVPWTAPTAYTVFPAVGFVGFQAKRRSTRVRTVRNDEHISAVWDGVHNTAMVVFWDAAGGTITVDRATITASANAVVIYRMGTGEVTVSDPGQTLQTLQLEFSITVKGGSPRSETLDIELPSGGLAGSSISKTLSNP